MQIKYGPGFRFKGVEVLEYIPKGVLASNPKAVVRFPCGCENTVFVTSVASHLANPHRVVRCKKCRPRRSKQEYMDRAYVSQLVSRRRDEFHECWHDWRVVVESVLPRPKGLYLRPASPGTLIGPDNFVWSDCIGSELRKRASEFGISKQLIRHRVRNGWTEEEACTTPPGKKRLSKGKVSA